MAGKNRVVVVIAGENQADKVLKEVQRGLGAVNDRALHVGRALAAVGAGLAAHRLAAWAKGLVDAGDAAFKTAQKVGVSVEALTGLQHAAQLSDVSNEALATGLRFLNRNIDEAQVKGSAAEATFRRLGVSVRDAAGQLRPTEQVLLDVAERFARMQDGAGKTALAMQLFGRAGADLIPLLNQGRAGIGGMVAEAERLGVVMDSKTAAAAERLNDAMRRAGAAVDGAGQQLLTGFLPPVAEVAERLSQTAAKMESLRGAGEELAAWVLGASKHVYGLGSAFNVMALWMERANLKVAQFLAMGATFGAVTDAFQGNIDAASVKMQVLRDNLAEFLRAVEGGPKGPGLAQLNLANWDQVMKNVKLPPALAAPPPPGSALAALAAVARGAYGLTNIDAVSPQIKTATDQLREMEAAVAGVQNQANQEALSKFLGALQTPIVSGWAEQLQALETQIDVIFTNLQARTEEIRGLVAQGAISELEGQQRIVELHRATGVELDLLLPKYRELAALTRDPKLAAGVEALAVQVKNLKSETDVLAASARELFVDGFANAMAGIVSGTENVVDAFKNMARSIVAELTRIIMKMLMIWLLNKLLGGLLDFGGGGGSAQSLADSFAGPFAQGGSFGGDAPFITGELGPELVVPSTSGAVMSNSSLRRMMAGGGGDTFIINAPGADIGVVQRLEALEKTMPQAVPAAVRATQELYRRS